MTRAQEALAGQAAEAIQALVVGRHGNPFTLLGPHEVNGRPVP